jgi:hypothetical protein
MVPTARRRLWKILAAVLVAASLVLVLGSTFLWYHFASNRPTAADPKAGRVHALNTHGSIVYLTGAERARLYFLEGTAASCFVGAVLIHILVLRRNAERAIC